MFSGLATLAECGAKVTDDMYWCFTRVVFYLDERTI